MNVARKNSPLRRQSGSADAEKTVLDARWIMI
jgi:hypothetical protein